MKGQFLGEFEQLVLLAVHRLGATAYGGAIASEIEERTGRPLSIGAVHATLTRLEDKGYLRSRMGEPEPVRGGRGKRLFTLAPAGVRALRVTKEMLGVMWDGVDLDADPRAV